VEELKSSGLLDRRPAIALAMHDDAPEMDDTAENDNDLSDFIDEEA
jgi:hypothetical protein